MTNTNQSSKHTTEAREIISRPSYYGQKGSANFLTVAKGTRSPMLINGSGRTLPNATQIADIVRRMKPD